MGVKRKIEDLEEKNVGGQRQSILDISMFKLQTHPERKVEPPLLRSVLILNTLKHIENELHKEGVPSELSEAATITLNDSSDLTMDVLPDSHMDHSATDGFGHPHADSFIQHDFSEMHINSSPSYQSTPPCASEIKDVTTTMSPVASVHSYVNKETTSPLPPIETFVELSNAFTSTANALSFSSMKQSFQENLKETISSFEHHQQHCKITKPSEDVLGDVDISHCDFDIFSSLASSMKLTPLSAEEVMHSFPVHSGVIQDSGYPQVFNSVGSSCKSDLLPEEIDNIMQILVGT